MESFQTPFPSFHLYDIDRYVSRILFSDEERLEFDRKRTITKELGKLHFENNRYTDVAPLSDQIIEEIHRLSNLIISYYEDQYKEIRGGWRMTDKRLSAECIGYIDLIRSLKEMDTDAKVQEMQETDYLNLTHRELFILCEYWGLCDREKNLRRSGGIQKIVNLAAAVGYDKSEKHMKSEFKKHDLEWVNRESHGDVLRMQVERMIKVERFVRYHCSDEIFERFQADLSNMMLRLN